MPSVFLVFEKNVWYTVNKKGGVCREVLSLLWKRTA